jgi:general secretion pathway protein A
MYESYFGLACEAFSVAPDPRFLYLSQKHRDALAHLNYGLRRGGGFVLLTGEVGAGKTTVWRSFLEQLPGHCDVAYIGNPKLGIDALLARIAEELRVEPPEHREGYDAIDAIHGHLLLAHAAGRRALIVVDEAQALAPDVLEQLRLLTNLVVSADRKLLQVLLIGQPELRTMLQQPALEPVSQRVVARYHLPALERDETVAYIAHRLAVAGLEGDALFDDTALRRIHNLCQGVPRRINVLCDRSLLLAQQEGRRQVDGDLVIQAAREVFDEAQQRKPAAAPAAPAEAMLPIVQALPAQRHPFAPVVAAAAATLAIGLWIGGHRAPAGVATPAPASAQRLANAQPSTPANGGRGATTTDDATSATAAEVERPQAGAARPATLTLPATVANGAGRTDDAALAALFTPTARDEANAWRALAALWGVSLPAGDPCSVAPQRALHCYRAVGWLGPVRLLQRPGVLTLADEQGDIAHVLLLAIDEHRARLRVGSVEREVPLAQLERVWRGDFATLWRAPAGYRTGQPGEPGTPFADWLAEHLPAAPAASAPPGARGLSARVFAFQLAHGLPPDGLPGPLTLMQINRSSGVDEPRLQALR